MGDRANIYLTKVSDTEHGIYLCTHWSGCEFPEKLREALAFGRGRWSDDQYLGRIITSRVFADLVDSEIGGGLSLEICDNEYPIIIVDLDDQAVAFAPEGDEKNADEWVGRTTFTDYVKQERADYPTELR